MYYDKVKTTCVQDHLFNQRNKCRIIIIHTMYILLLFEVPLLYMCINYTGKCFDPGYHVNVQFYCWYPESTIMLGNVSLVITPCCH